MIPNDFQYVRANSVKDAVSLLDKHGENAKVLAGGHSLIPAMKLRLNAPATLIDVSNIGDLTKIGVNGNKLQIGALATHRSVETSDVVKKNCSVLSEAAAHIGDAQVRNRGTIGGNLAHADPASDYPALVLALDAELEVEGKSGKRTIAADDFFEGLFETALESDEIIANINFPTLGKGTGAAYEKFPHPASRFAVVGVAAMLTLDKKGTCTSARIGVTGAAPWAFRATDVEDVLTGKPLDEKAISDATAKVGDPADMLSDATASPEFRAHLCSVMARRALMKAMERAK
ncbi:xanthine dehydrogenase family protein subunit M [candidate division KSB1 bacterium]|nr:xanthine dehydrogenase family protein subunit M [candidate division KSB1 bacterium]NIR73074.1 xanthine dehydrogenase family protein subunit M [candidate division KSB1 bacterium]NIS28315.1 xanthine dehydrogenase family protein subunit M [candidate division KSB1 bacterium]NIT75184.1 xanthine dehydrogenase family protein subunit M [candidate division KSB1 bacterium]NIU29021.1 xanthine dehydrogenase family protein subunit M [candidate division KSB1 bacterium]